MKFIMQFYLLSLSLLFVQGFCSAPDIVNMCSFVKARIDTNVKQ